MNRKPDGKPFGKNYRLDAVNQFIRTIASCGRKFFRYEDRIAWIERDPKGLLFLHNEYSQRRIYISRRGGWRGFHHGGTLHGLMQCFVEFIRSGKQLRENMFESRWGYGDDMDAVITSGKDLGIIKRPVENVIRPPDPDKPRLTSASISRDTARRLSAMLGQINTERKDAAMPPLTMITVVSEACEAWMKHNQWMIENGVSERKI